MSIIFDMFSENGHRRGQSAGDSRRHSGAPAAGAGSLPAFQGPVDYAPAEAGGFLPLSVFPP